MTKCLALLPFLLLAACHGDPQAAATNFKEVPRVDGPTIDKVLARVKQEVGLFYSDGAKAEANWNKLLADLGVDHPTCGDGHIAFKIESIKMEFEAVNDRTNGGSAGLKIPFGPGGVGNIGPKYEASTATTGSINLAYTYKPLASGSVSTDYDIIRDEAIILPTLDHLRDGLIKATKIKPCFYSLTDKDPAQTLTFYVEVIPDQHSSLGFNFYVLEASASHETKQTYKNTITVSYRPILFKGGQRNLMQLHEAINHGKSIPSQLLVNRPDLLEK